jgi:hypothetical protein
MGQKTSKATLAIPAAARVNYAVYLLSNTAEETLSHVHLEVAAHGSHAVVLFPDPQDTSASSSGARHYKAVFIQDGHWVNEAGNRKEISLGNQHFSQARLSPLLSNHAIQVMSPQTPQYQSILKQTLAAGGLLLSAFEKLPAVVHQEVIARLPLASLTAVKPTTRTLYALYKPEETKRIVKKLLGHAVLATQEDIQQIKKILATPSSRNPVDQINYLQKLLCTPGTVKGYNGRIYKDRTLYQLALGAREYNVISENGIQVVEGLVELLGTYFEKLPNGKTLQQQQYATQFPAGYEEKENERISTDSRELKRVIGVIGNATDADCQQTLALDSFHGYDLRRASSVANDNDVLASAIYLHAERDSLRCRFRGLDGQVKTHLISWHKLVEVPHSVDKIIEKKPAYVAPILEQLAEPGQFYTPHQIQALKVLSQATVTALADDFEDKWTHLEVWMKNNVGRFLTLNLTVLKALYHFRHSLEPKDAYNTTGHHSNPELLLEAYQLYDANFAGFGNDWSSPKNVLCVQKIMGFAQRDLSACELQLHAQGLYGVLVAGNKSRRTFAFTYGGGMVLPLDLDPFLRLGYNYLVGRGRRAGAARGLGVQLVPLWKSYVKQKHQCSKTYAPRWESIEARPSDKSRMPS